MSTKPNLSPVPSEGSTCANCSAPLVADQRYCLACGQPVSPVRLAFLDVLQSDRQQASPQALATTPVAYAPVYEPSGSTSSWLRRYTPLFSVASVLLLALLAGLLLGHWATQSNKTTPATQVIKVEGLSAGAPAAASTTPAPTASTPATSGSKAAAAAKSSPKSEAEEVVKEAKAEKQQAAKVEHTEAVKSSSDKVKKLGSSTGKKHEEEVNALGEAPIETGG